MAVSVTFDYVEYGFVARCVPEGTVYLDVGNTFLPGVIDHHHIRSHPVWKSATRMVYELLSETGQKELWPSSKATRARLEKYRQEDRPVRILLHQNPDFDALISAFLLYSYLQGEPLPENILSQGIIDLADQVDRGNFAGEVFGRPNWYFALQIFVARVQLDTGISEECRAEALRKLFFESFRKFIDSRRSATDFFATTDLGGQVIDFLAQVENMGEQAGELLQTRFPVFEFDEKGQGRIVPREVLWIEWTNDLAAVFNLYKARFRKKGGPIWVVHDPNERSGRGKLTFSLEHSEPYSLFGYGWALERLEVEHRFELDDPRYPVRLGQPRPGYDGFDPWYDGRNQTYTIVDAPNCGTVLLANDARSWLEREFAFDKAYWSRYRVDALLDTLKRMGKDHCAEFAKGADGLNAEFKDRWKNELDGLSPIVHALIDNVQDNPALSRRLVEGLVGFSLMVGQSDLVANWLSLAGAGMFTGDKISPKDRGIAGEIFLTSSGYQLLQLTATFSGDPSHLPLQYLTDPRRELFQNLIDLTPSFKQASENDPSFIRVCEYIELLRQIQADRADEDLCLWDKGLPGLVGISESELMAKVGVDNPMLHSFRDAKEKASFLLGIYNLARTAGMGDSERVATLQQDAHLDTSAEEFLKELVAFYEQVLRLGETMDRHGHNCKECRRGIQALLRSFAGLQKRGSQCGSGVLAERLGEVRQVLNSLRGAIKHDRAISSIYDKTCRTLEGFIEQGETSQGSFPFDLIKPGLKDSLKFLNTLQKLENEINELLENGDERQIETMAQEMLFSITLEESYDNRDVDLNEKLSVLYPAVKSDKTNSQISWKNLFHGRRALKKQGKSNFIGKSDNSSSGNLRAMHLTGQEALMDVPFSLKKASLGKLIKTLQSKMSLNSSSDLIDISFGRSLTQSNFFKKLFLPVIFPFFPCGSISFVFYVWVFLGLGFIAAMGTAETGGFVWFTAGLSIYLLLLVIRFLKPGFGTKKRLLDEEFERDLLFGQIMPRFLVPMALCLSPFIMSQELGEFLYIQVGSLDRFLFLIAIFGGLSFFALTKFCSSEKKGNIWRGFGTLWGQSFVLAYLIPIFLQNCPLLFELEGKSKKAAIQAMLDANIVGIPRMVELFPIGEVVIYAFPVASVLFSFLCLFVAIFLENLGNQGKS